MKSKHENKAIGIIGGMGPEASIYIQQVILRHAQKYFGAKNNHEYPEIVMNSIPVPDFISNTQNLGEALAMLKKRVKKFNGKDFVSLSLACNTAHLFLGELQETTDVPFVSIIEEVVRSISTFKLNTVGVLATPFTIKHNLYQNCLAQRKINSVIPEYNQLMSIEKIIRNVISGKHSKKDRVTISEIATSLQTRGARGIILGCTELPLIFPKKFPLPVFDSVEILSSVVLKGYYSQNLEKKGGEI